MRIELGRYIFELTQDFKNEDELVDFIINTHSELDRDVVKSHIKRLKLKFNDTDRLVKQSENSEKRVAIDDSRSFGKKQNKRN